MHVHICLCVCMWVQCLDGRYIVDLHRHIVVIVQFLQKSVWTTFQEKQKTVVIFRSEDCFKIICTKYILRFIRWVWLVLPFYYLFLMKKNYVIFNSAIFCSKQIKIQHFLSYVLKAYAIYLHWDRQPSWPFYTLNKIHNFESCLSPHEP